MSSGKGPAPECLNVGYLFIILCGTWIGDQNDEPVVEAAWPLPRWRCRWPFHGASVGRGRCAFDCLAAPVEGPRRVDHRDATAAPTCCALGCAPPLRLSLAYMACVAVDT